MIEVKAKSKKMVILYDFRNWQSVFSLERPEKPPITHPVLYFTSSAGNNEICSSWFVSVVYAIPGTVILGSVFQLETFPLGDSVINETYIWSAWTFSWLVLIFLLNAISWIPLKADKGEKIFIAHAFTNWISISCVKLRSSRQKCSFWFLWSITSEEHLAPFYFTFLPYHSDLYTFPLP